MPKLGDIVFYKGRDGGGEPVVMPAIVTRVATDADGEWAKGREIVDMTTFGPNGHVDSIDADKGTLDDDGNWEPGGWATTEDGSDLGNAESADVVPGNNAALPAPPTETAVTGTPTVPTAPAGPGAMMDDHPSGLDVPLSTTGADASQPMTQVVDTDAEKQRLRDEIEALQSELDSMS